MQAVDPDPVIELDIEDSQVAHRCDSKGPRVYDTSGQVVQPSSVTGLIAEEETPTPPENTAHAEEQPPSAQGPAAKRRRQEQLIPNPPVLCPTGSSISSKPGAKAGGGSGFGKAT